MVGLHEKFGLNPSIEFCGHCWLEFALVLLGNTIPGQAKGQTLIECTKRCQLLKLVVLVEKMDEEETGYCLTGTMEELGKYSKGKPGKMFVTTNQMRKILGVKYRQPGAIEMK